MINLLPPYSPDFNSIELSFDILKAWMRRHWRRIWSTFGGDFRGFFEYAINCSEYDQFAIQQFKYTAKRYIFEGDYEVLERDF